jgi:hypothetical protein
VRGIEVQHARWNGISFHGLIDSGKDDGILRYVNNSSASSEIGDDLVFMLLLGKSARRARAEHTEQKKESDSTHEYRPRGQRIASTPVLHVSLRRRPN